MIYHKSFDITELSSDLNLHLKLNLELQNIDISIANGLRRVLYAEVDSVNISPDMDIL